MLFLLGIFLGNMTWHSPTGKRCKAKLYSPAQWSEQARQISLSLDPLINSQPINSNSPKKVYRAKSVLTEGNK